MVTKPFRPRSRKDIKIAIICALPLEAESVRSSFDNQWLYDYGKSPGDTNTYSIGTIGKHNVVLVCMPGVGTNSATATALNLCASFPDLKFGFLVGICAASPSIGSEEIILGDCLISTHVVQYDFGRQHEDKFIRKKSAEDSLGRASPEIRSLLATLAQAANKHMLTERLLYHLSAVQLARRGNKADYPGTKHDQLFESSYHHEHRPPDECCECLNYPGFCTKDCESIGCSSSRSIMRRRLCSEDSNDYLPRIHFARFGSANTVMRSARRRDEIVEEENLHAFDMESSGIWDHIPTIVVKSASDYADSHKNKIWQHYAATTATCALKAILEQIQVPSHGLSIKMLPFPRDPQFTAREDILTQLLSSFQCRKPHYQMRKALVGMGGVGKTQIAIEFAYRLLQLNPQHSIFWIHASSVPRLEEGYREIARHAKIPVSKTSHVLTDVMDWLSDEHNGEWTMILDNVDDDRVFTAKHSEGKVLRDFLPTTSYGSILLTSRFEVAATNLVGLGSSTLVDPMTMGDSLELLGKKMNITESDYLAARELIEKLEYLPLAITHACAYMVVKRISLMRYNAMLQKERDQIKLLAFDQHLDLRRDASAERAVIMTWHISFSTLDDENPGAASLLSLLGMFDNASIPILLLRKKSSQSDEDDLDLEEHIGILLSYSLISPAEVSSLTIDSIKIHRLVQLALRRWLGEYKKLPSYQKQAADAIIAVRQLSEYNAKDIWLASELIPHAKQVMKYDVENRDQPKLLSKIGELLYICDLSAEAEEYLSEAISLKRQSIPIGALDQFQDMRIYAVVLVTLNRYTEAESICREAIQKCENSEIRHGIYFDLQQLSYATMARLGHQYEAEPQLLDLLERQSSEAARDSIVFINTLRSLCNVYFITGQYEQYCSMAHRSYEEAQERLDPDHMLTLSTANSYGLSLACMGKHEESEEVLLKCFARCKNVFGLKNHLTWATTDSLATSFQRQTKFCEAESLFREARDAVTEMLGSFNGTSIVITINLIDCLVEQGKLEEAESLCRTTLSQLRIHLKEDTTFKIGRILLLLGRILHQKADLQQAETHLREALSYFDTPLGAQAPRTQEAANHLCKTLEALDKKQEAEALRKIHNLPSLDENADDNV